MSQKTQNFNSGFLFQANIFRSNILEIAKNIILMFLQFFYQVIFELQLFIIIIKDRKIDLSNSFKKMFPRIFLFIYFYF